jgi:hypothetical protein
MKSISINNRKLHEVEMLLLPYDQRTVSYLKYPKHRIQFEIEGDKLFLNIPVSLALELYRTAILPQNSDAGVSVKVSGKRVGEFRVVDFRYANSLSKDRNMVSITFQRVTRRST